MARPKHPKKEIEKSIQYAESKGWRVEISKGHAWGRIYCFEGTTDGCKISISSTPKTPTHEAKRIIKYIDVCIHTNKEKYS